MLVFIAMYCCSPVFCTTSIDELEDWVDNYAEKGKIYTFWAVNPDTKEIRQGRTVVK